MYHALVMDDETVSRQFFSATLAEQGVEVSGARTLDEARRILRRRSADILVLDLVVPDGNGLDILRELDSRCHAQVLVITGHSSIETITEALRLGAVEYISKPVEPERLRSVLSGIIRSLEYDREIHSLRDHLRELGEFGPLLGASLPMQKVYDLITKVAPTEATVLIEGESGTGKELAAQAIHQFSRRSKGPFIPVNCGAIPPNLMESELFGHEKGSFTGASRQHQGFFERATRGTLFLDEIVEMPVELQAKLLRVLEEGSILRVGGGEPVLTDARVIAATNCDTRRAVEEGKFREDLLYRLNVFPIHMPRLCERDDDVNLLAGAFLRRLNKEAGTAKKLTARSMDCLRSHDWPGNVRELRNLIERAFIDAGDQIEPGNLFLQDSPALRTAGPGLVMELGISLAEAQQRLIHATLQYTGGDKKRAAEILGISVRTLYYRLKEGKSRPGS